MYLLFARIGEQSLSYHVLFDFHIIENIEEETFNSYCICCIYPPVCIWGTISILTCGNPSISPSPATLSLHQPLNTDHPFPQPYKLSLETKNHMLI